jgi:hypothetical protein
MCGSSRALRGVGQSVMGFMEVAQVKNVRNLNGLNSELINLEQIPHSTEREASGRPFLGYAGLNSILANLE